MFCGFGFQLKPGHPIPSPSELMGKILIKNKKSSAPPSKPEQAKKPSVNEVNEAADGSESNQPADPNQPAPANPEGNDPPASTGEFLCKRALKQVFTVSGLFKLKS